MRDKAFVRDRLFRKARSRSRRFISEMKVVPREHPWAKGERARVDHFATAAIFFGWRECQEYCDYDLKRKLQVRTRKGTETKT